MRCPQFNWLPIPLWKLWRDVTWASEARAEFLAKMQRYYDRGGISKTMAIGRCKALVKGVGVSDWDDNVPTEWARTLLQRWGNP